MTGSSAGAQFLSSYVWTADEKDFGGYSAISLTPDGQNFVLLSDRAHVIEGSIFRHGERIIGVRSREIEKLNIPKSLFREKPEPDTEGLARDVFGRLYVSLESENAVFRRSVDGAWDRLPDFGPIDDLPKNRGLEAIAISAEGAVFAIPEASGGLRAPFDIFRYSEDGGWQVALRLTRSDGFLPVGADFGPDGLLYVLERGFDGLGFFSRVRRVPVDTDAVTEGETLLRTQRWQHDNLEGLAVWQTETGALRLTMVSDDNFSRFQKTEIVEYALV